MASEIGNSFECRVTGVRPFGAFVSLPEGRVGMVHISEVSHEFVQDLAAVLHEGDEVKVQVIQTAPDGKIALSMKRLQPRPARPERSPKGGAGAPRDAGRPRARAAEPKPRVWQPKAPARSDNMSFEDMMSRFKSQSEEKMADLDHETNRRRGGGYAPRSRRGGR